MIYDFYVVFHGVFYISSIRTVDCVCARVQITLIGAMCQSFRLIKLKVTETKS